MLSDLVRKNRSYRRFKQDQAVSRQTLLELVDLARLSPCGRNIQALKYILINESGQNKQVFNTLGWAAYLKDWNGPQDGEQPAAYIIMVLDKRISPAVNCDHGIAAQSILLGAVEKGLGGCIIATIRKEQLIKYLDLDANLYEILLVLAIGSPLENVILEDLAAGGDIRYWRDPDGGHHVPKRPLKDIVLK